MSKIIESWKELHDLSPYASQISFTSVASKDFFRVKHLLLIYISILLERDHICTISRRQKEKWNHMGQPTSISATRRVRICFSVLMTVELPSSIQTTGEILFDFHYGQNACDNYLLLMPLARAQ